MKKTLLGLLTTFAGSIANITSVFAECSEAKLKQGCVSTAILGNGCVCDKNGSSVIHILSLVVDIMSIGIGILGVIGITIVGIQYLTAGGSEEKTRKAKRRMFEIVIGIVAYVLLYAFLKWLLPAGIK